MKVVCNQFDPTWAPCRGCPHNKPHEEDAFCPISIPCGKRRNPATCKPTPLCPTCHQPLDKAALINQIIKAIQDDPISYQDFIEESVKTSLETSTIEELLGYLQ
jgi:hypothetical protein